MTSIQHEPCTRLHLTHDLAAITDARHQLVAELRAVDLDVAVVQDAELVLSELASNAVEHGSPRECGHVEVAWCVYPQRVRITVRDSAVDTSPEEVVARLQPLQASATAERGRGLAIVDHVCDNWGADVDEHGIKVTAELSFEDPSRAAS